MSFVLTVTQSVTWGNPLLFIFRKIERYYIHVPSQFTKIIKCV